MTDNFEPSTDLQVVAGGLGEFVKRTTAISPGTKAVVQRFIPYPAVATANTCNIYLMRRSEMSTGISITDERGTHLATSTEAAKKGEKKEKISDNCAVLILSFFFPKAIKETALTRIVLPAPILVIPPIVMGFIEKTSLFVKRPYLRLPVHAAVVTAAFGFALPLAISVFPQTGAIEVSKLEPSLRALTDPDGKKIETVFYNKGL